MAQQKAKKTDGKWQTVKSWIGDNKGKLSIAAASAIGIGVAITAYVLKGDEAAVVEASNE